jgi:hypothetical protein
MLRWLHTLCRREVADVVPADMDMCLDCGELDCSEDRYQNCAARKRRAAELQAVRTTKQPPE